MSRITTIKQRGNALVYLAIILVLGSIAALTTAKYYAPKKDVENQQILTQKLNKIAQAIDVFVGTYGRLPCPASPNILNSDTNFGLESRDPVTFECNASGIISNPTTGNVRYIGAVPGKTLGLNDAEVVDPWGNRIEYVVSNAMYKNKTENSNNNWYNTNSVLQLQDGVGNNLESAAAYILISRGQNQLGAWPATGTTQIQLPPLNNLERHNLGCQLNGNGCGGANFGPIFISNPNLIDDVLLYRNKNNINSNCEAGDSNSSCNNVPCSSSQWTVGGNGTITITPTNLPSLTIPSNITAQQGMGYALTLNLNSLNTTGGSFQLMYQYTTTSSSTVQTVEIAEFASSSFSGQYDSTYIGKNLTIYFGDQNQIPKGLYFAKTATAGSMVISNVLVQVAPLYYQNFLNYKIWKNICDNGNGCGCCGDDDGCCCGCGGCGCGGCGCGGCGCGGCGCGGCNTCSLTNLLNSSSYPNNPDYQSVIPTAQGFTSYGNNYYSMISGYFTPDETAQYTFSIAADQIATLYMSPDANLANAVQVASRTTASAPLAWTSSGATTYTVSLTTGQSYYFYVLQMAGTSGKDNLSLGCSKTNSSGTTPTAVLGTGTDTLGCGGTVSTAPMLTVLNQVQCQ